MAGIKPHGLYTQQTVIKEAKSPWIARQLTRARTVFVSTEQVDSAATSSLAQRRFLLAMFTCEHMCMYSPCPSPSSSDALFPLNKRSHQDLLLTPYSKAAKALTDSHVTFITMPDSAQGTNKHLRIGGQSKILMYNRETDDATLPDLSPQGIATSKALPTNAWTCFEYHLGTDGSVATWLNNVTVPALTVGNGATNANAGQWTRSSVKPKIKGVYFGWESYGGDTNTMWYDDIVVSSSRIGC